jgi:hypothetical protein
MSSNPALQVFDVCRRCHGNNVAVALLEQAFVRPATDGLPTCNPNRPKPLLERFRALERTNLLIGGGGFEPALHRHGPGEGLWMNDDDSETSHPQHHDLHDRACDRLRPWRIFIRSRSVAEVTRNGPTTTRD